MKLVISLLVFMVSSNLAAASLTCSTGFDDLDVVTTDSLGRLVSIQVTAANGKAPMIFNAENGDTLTMDSADPEQTIYAATGKHGEFKMVVPTFQKGWKSRSHVFIKELSKSSISTTVHCADMNDLERPEYCLKEGEYGSIEDEANILRLDLCE